MQQQELSNFIHQLPKAELHIHLEGAVAPSTVLELANRHHMQDTLPSQKVDELQKWFRFTDFNHFVVIYMTIQALMRKPDDFALIAYKLGEDMADQNILYREATFTPYTHINYQDKGLAIEDILEGLEHGRQKAKADFGVEIRWVFDIPRNLGFMSSENGKYNPEPADKTLEYAKKGMDKGVIGLGIGGYEVGAPAKPFRHSFLEAKQVGLLSVPHAGETMGPDSIWSSVQDLQADRIGHGVRAIEDTGLMEYLRQHQITLEVNPTSNLCLHVYPSLEAHPFKILDDFGIPVTINSDDPPLFNTSLSQEYALIAETFNYSRSDLVRIARNAFLATGAESELKQSLLHKFEAAVADLF